MQSLPSVRPMTSARPTSNTTSLNDIDLQPDAGARWADALARRFPGPHKAKRIAVALGRDVRTVQGWLAGQPPHFVHAVDAANTLSDPLLLVEVTGLDLPTQADVVRVVAQAQREIADLDARIAKLSGGRFGQADD